MDTLNNGAKVIDMQRVCDEGFLVLASWHGQFVTWNVSSAGDAFTGHYFSDIVEATADYAQRAGLV